MQHSGCAGTLTLLGDKLGKNAPAVFYVNWFRKSPEGKWLWPGYGDNSRVLKWMCERVEGKAKAVETPIGLMPQPGDLDLAGLTIGPADVAELLRVDVAAWKAELPDIEEHLGKAGSRLPARMQAQLAAFRKRLGA